MAKKLQQSELDGPVVDEDRPSIEQALAERYPSGCLTLRSSDPPEKWPTSLEVGSRRWKAVIINSDCTSDVEVGDAWSEPFLVTDWLVKWRESADERTGEVSRYPWLVLVCKNGDLIGTSSEVVPHQLARALRNYTSEEWRDGVAFRIRRRLNRAHTKSYHEIRVVE